MTNIVMRQDGEVWRLDAQGHAGYDDTGRDIVCSAVSMMCCTLGVGLDSDPGVIDLTVEQEPGRYQLTAWLDSKGESARGKISMAATGFELLAAQYPNHIKFVSVGV